MTLTIIESEQKVMPQRAGGFANVTDAVRRMHTAGIKLLVGTDSNNTNALCHIRHGESILHEFELLHDAGMSNLEILQGVTTEAARIFGLTDRGTIEVGKRADLRAITLGTHFSGSPRVYLCPIHTFLF